VRLDHLLSKESCLDRSGRGLPVDHWLFGPCTYPAAVRVRPVPLEGAARPAPNPSMCDGRTSLFRFEGATLCRCFRDVDGFRARRPLASFVRPTCQQERRQCAPLENSIASTSIFVLQATKSQRWMPWRLKPKKDVGGCEKPRGAADQASIRGCPNGETRHPSWGVTPV
jgi:hypothetical protein